jgi:hypothetical protein
MPTWGWIVIAVVAVVVLAVIALQARARQRTKHLEGRFGPEYNRTLESAGDRKAAEQELAQREERREQLEIRPLSAETASGYQREWEAVQAQFVDDPSGAVTQADALIQRVMAERGYPVDDFEQRAADVSVDHPDVVEHYRQGHKLAVANVDGKGDTESLRRAMRHYRALFEQLVRPAEDTSVARDDATETTTERTARR